QARHVGKVVLTVPAPVRGDAAVVVTGGTGGLGRLVAQHLAESGQAGELVLLSRSGPAAPDIAELAAHLAQSGTAVRITACDVADREALKSVLATVRRLDGVFHAAGVLDDAVVTALTPERMRRVLGVKATGAWNLHELTSHLDVSRFVLFSSVAGVWGNPGQGNYAAANTFLDALAEYRQGHGLAGISLAWGPWAQSEGMAGGMAQADLDRMGRAGLALISDAEGLALLDAALDTGRATLVTARLNNAALTQDNPSLPPVLAQLARKAGSTASTAPAGGGDLAARLAGQTPEQQSEILIRLIQTQAAMVLGANEPNSIAADRPFRDLGFDSLTTVELRNRLNAATGLRLPATVLFDYSTADALAAYLAQELADSDDGEDGTLAAFSELEKIELSLDRIAADETTRSRLAAQLTRILAGLNATREPADGETEADRILDASDDEVFAFIDQQLGI
ncbi:type I polyketide synthase, partial [Streptomyces mirabilis]